MRKGILLLIGIIVLASCTYAQSNYLSKTFDKFQRGMYHFSMMNMDSAYSCFNSAGVWFFFGGNPEMQLSSFMAEAYCAMMAGEVDLALKAYDAALDLAKENGNDLVEYQIYTFLRNAYLFKSDMNAAMRVESSIDSLSAATSNVRVKFEIMKSLVSDAIQHNDLALAEHYLMEMEEGLEVIPEEDRLSASMELSALFRQLYCLWGKWDKAKPYSRQVIEYGREVYTHEHDRNLYYLNYDIEAEICARMGNKEGAFAALDSIRYGLELTKNIHPVMWSRYHRCVGNIHMMFNEWDSACVEFQKAWDVWEKDSNDYYDEDYSMNAVLLSEALRRAGKYEEAKAYLQDFLRYCSLRFGNDGLEYARALCMLGNIEGWSGDFKRGEQDYSKAVALMMDFVRNNLRYVSAQERATFWNTFFPIVYNMPAYALKAGNSQDGFVEQCYNGLLTTKSFLLESERSTAELIENQCTEEERKMYYEFLQLQQQIKEWTRNPEENKDVLSTAHERLLSVNRKLTPIMSRLEYTDYLKTTFQSVRNALRSNEFLIDFTDFKSDEGLHRHVAFKIDGRSVYPELIKSFTTEEIDSLLEGLPLDQLYDTTMASNVKNLIWEPIMKNIPTGATVYYVPSGRMHQIVLESLPMADGSLLGDHYRIVRLSSARELFRSNPTLNMKANDSVVLYGGLAYSVDTSSMLAEATMYDSLPIYDLRNRRSLRGDSIFRSLPLSKTEVETIEKIVSERGFKSKVCKGSGGTEESFVNLSGRAPAVLHLATHGFFYSSRDTNRSVSFLQGYNDAMMLTGLVFSGANRAWLGKPLPGGVMSGVLSASGIATLNFRNTEMLVLSACHSGSGEATPEGLYGLQRAFKRAGVKTLVLSLWEVDDEVGAKFMILFYEYLFEEKNHWDKRAAFEKAKKTIRKKYPEPFYWAGFVMLD